MDRETDTWWTEAELSAQSQQLDAWMLTANLGLLREGTNKDGNRTRSHRISHVNVRSWLTCRKWQIGIKVNPHTWRCEPHPRAARGSTPGWALVEANPRYFPTYWTSLRRAVSNLFVNVCQVSLMSTAMFCQQLAQEFISEGVHWIRVVDCPNYPRIYKELLGISDQLRSIHKMRDSRFVLWNSFYVLKESTLSAI